MAKEKVRAGAPVIFNRVVKAAIISSFRDGKSRAEICKNLGISIDTLHDWSRSDKEFSEAIAVALDDYMKYGAEACMSDLALGKAYATETITTRKKNDDGEWEEVVEVVNKKQLAPDYRAARFIMHNRFRNKWNKPSVSTLDFGQMTDEQLLEFADMAMEMKRNREKKPKEIPE